MMRFFEPALLIKDLDLYKQIFIKDFDHFVDHQNLHLSEEMDPLFAKGLVFLKGKPFLQFQTNYYKIFVEK